ncbi:MAG: NAD-dependent epimerase/dehydratase family protein [Cytophagaceae bacterium]
MKIKAVIFGSSGMIGQGVLQECLEGADVESVLIINRSQSRDKHEKLKEIVHKDFSDFSNLSNELKQYDTCFFCLGVTSVGLSEEEYSKITFDLTTRVAETLLKTGKEYTFCYISGASTDSTEKGKTMWARVKGKTENTLLAMPFKQAFMFRPGYIQPLNGIRSKTKLYNAIYFVFKPLYFLLKPFKGMVTDTSSMGKAMINVALKGYEKKILESSDINSVANS